MLIFDIEVFVLQMYFSYILSCRTAVFEGDNELRIYRKNILQLVPFSNEKIIDFLYQWDFVEGKDYWELYDKIINNYQLHKLAENPLLLTLIAYLYDKSKLVIVYIWYEIYNINRLVSLWRRL